MILRPYSLLVLLGCVYLASTDYGAAKHTKVIVKAAGPSKEHPWVGYTRHYPRSIPRPLIIKKWHPYWDPTYVASWVSSKPIAPIGHGGGHHHDGGHGGGHGGGYGGSHGGGHGGDHGGGHGGGHHHDEGHGGGHDLTSGKGGHGFISEDIPHGFGPPKLSSVGAHGHSDFHGGSDFVPPTSYQEPALAPVQAYVPPEPVQAYVPPEPVQVYVPPGPVYADDAAGEIITGSVGPTGPAYVPPNQGSILPPIESPPIYIPQEIAPTFNELNTGYVAPFQGLDPRSPSPFFKAEPIYHKQIIGSGDSAEDFRSQLFSGNFAKAIPTQQFAHSVPEVQQVQFGGGLQQYSGTQDSVAPFVVPPQSAPLPLENEGNLLSNSIDDTYSQAKRDTNN